MKNYLLILFAFVLLAGCKEAKKNEVAPAAPSEMDENLQLAPTPDKTIIFIRAIDEIPQDATNINIYDFIQLYDNHGNVSESNQQSIENFTSPIYSGRKVKWKKSQLSMQNIQVKKIMRKNVSDPELMEQSNISGNNNEVERMVRTGQEDGAVEHYKIEIWVKIPKDNGQSGENWKPFTIDPKAVYHP